MAATIHEEGGGFVGEKSSGDALVSTSRNAAGEVGGGGGGVVCGVVSRPSPESRQTLRPRALSDVSTQSGTDVGTVVSKAKRAAKSLWMIIHAQNCRFAGNCCPHGGCQDTKRLLLHVKTCPAGPDFDCPEGFHGCHQAKKLLSHYRRCREIRARQARQPPAKRLLRQQEHCCLVCSLMARHARSVLEAGKAARAMGGVANKNGRRRDEFAFASHVSSEGSRVEKQEPDSSSTVVRSASMQTMPPPPPRPPQQPSCSVHPTMHPTNACSEKMSSPSSLAPALSPSSCAPVSPNVLANDPSGSFTPPPTGEASPVYCTPPPQSVLMQQRIADVAAATAPPLFVLRPPPDPSLLGKSVDSSRTSFLSRPNPPADAVSKPRCNSSREDGLLQAPKARRRPRAESYDERSSSLTRSPVNLSSSPSEVAATGYGNDPTIEAMLTSDQDRTREPPQSIEVVQTAQMSKPLRFGQRSASCGTLSSLVNPVSCDTIAEDSSYHDEQLDEQHEEDEPVFMCDDG